MFRSQRPIRQVIFVFGYRFAPASMHSEGSFSDLEEQVGITSEQREAACLNHTSDRNPPQAREGRHIACRDARRLKAGESVWEARASARFAISSSPVCRA